MTENLSKRGVPMLHNKKDGHFGKRASNYDSVEGKFSRRVYRLLLEQVTLFSGANVLDVGCGTGTMLRKMADICPINGYGIDMEENMIAEAKRKCPDLQIQVARCEATPFENDFFDVITTCMAYHHFSDQTGFAKETSRILKPGGRLYIADPRLPFIFRKTMNGLFHLLNIAGGFNTPQELYRHFSKYGFDPDGFIFDGYAQVVKLKKK
jgi:ubiquinone/menaquinone biosynthesis C-methylase UbiE